ncbi:MAG: N-6 DNA methylase [Phycisphaerae bacterium]|nr:N-6 DNA methylase [Phycisphaerae bacterium]
MTISAHSAAALRPLLEECGYSDAQLVPDFRVGDDIYPLVGFASKPWDFDSACIAVVETSGKPEDAARTCRQLGAPIVWVQHNGIVDWWVQHGTAPKRFDSRPLDEFASLVRSRRADLTPEGVYRAKVLGRLPGARQLDFVDVGLMPLLRAEAGEKLGQLVEDMTRATLQGLGRVNPGKTMLRDVFTRVFRLLAGKILKDKEVDDFGALDLQDPATVLTAVAKHYNATEADTKLSREWKTALKPASELISAYGNVRVVSPESLAYVYEHTLVNKDLRKKLGIHATPPYLVDYIVWQLYDWICEIPQEDRHVFEPACGHAPFLLAAMRMLRLEMQGETDRRIHNYLKTHIHGVEIDDFALEIARLSLTLADIPNPNGWDLKPGDMYASDVLTQEAAKCRVLLSNPPYEAFGKGDQAKYKERGHEVRYKKAVEMLSRTLPELPVGGVFGVLVPQAVLNGPEAREVREVLLRDFTLAEICRFPGKVFEFAEMETAIILGRRHSEGFDPRSHRVRLRSVGEHGLSKFIENYSVEEDLSVPQSRFQRDPSFALTVPALDELWAHLDSNPRISDIAAVGRGIEFKGEEARNGVPVVLPHPKLPDYPSGFAGVARTTQEIFTTPPLRGLAAKADLIENPRQGMATGKPQVLVNRNRAARNRWRLKALLDPDGKPVKNNFLIVRPEDSKVPALFLWAILNSPIANAFVARDTMKRDNAESALGNVPIPRLDARAIEEVLTAAQAYRDLAAKGSAPTKRKPDQASLFQALPEVPDGPADSQICDALLAMDAAVLRAYDLASRLERQLLDFFSGIERKGVGCTFTGYFPADFKPTIPLWMYISDDFRRCRADYLISRVPQITDPVLVDALAEVE